MFGLNLERRVKLLEQEVRGLQRDMCIPLGEYDSEGRRVRLSHSSLLHQILEHLKLKPGYRPESFVLEKKGGPEHG